MTKENELSLLESRAMRDTNVNRTEVLEKVKKLFLIPGLEVMTVKQVAEYYEVGPEAIQKCYQRDKEEIDQDGVTIATPKNFLLGQNVQVTHTAHGTSDYTFGNGLKIGITNAKVKFFSRRAILRIGMLLRDSEVAKEVRTQLLNTFDHATVEQKTVDINEELELEAAVGKAYLSGKPEEILLACAAVNRFKDRHIATLTEANETLTDSNSLLAAGILEWSDRDKVSKAVRVIAGCCNVPFGYVWKELYDELLYKHDMGLKQRGKEPYIQHVKEAEWPNVQKSLAAICEKKHLVSGEIMKRARLEA